jgi:hypothetical protein
MTQPRQSTPMAVLVYGLAGVIPFVAPAVAASFLPPLKSVAAVVLALYSGLILSFLGGARWGLAVSRPEPSVGTVSLAMLPTLSGLALLILPAEYRGVQLLGLAAALVLQWLWDVSAGNLPAWYPRLRTILTLGAVVGLVAGFAVLT